MFSSLYVFRLYLRVSHIFLNSSGTFKNWTECLHVYVHVKTGFTVQDPVRMQRLVLGLILVGGADGAGAGTVGSTVAVILPEAGPKR